MIAVQAKKLTVRRSIAAVDNQGDDGDSGDSGTSGDSGDSGDGGVSGGGFSGDDPWEHEE